MSCDDDPLKRDRWARLRFAIIGPLLAAPPAAGDLQAALSELAARAWRHPETGLEVRFGASTIERWYYAARTVADPMTVLRNQIRSDIGSFPSVSAQAAEALRAQYLEHPGWTAYWQACQYAVNPKHLVMRRKLAMRPWRPLSGRSASHYSACVILPLFTGRSTCKASHLNIG